MARVQIVESEISVEQLSMCVFVILREIEREKEKGNGNYVVLERLFHILVHSSYIYICIYMQGSYVTAVSLSPTDFDFHVIFVLFVLQFFLHLTLFNYSAKV
ncbi:hypothetical protein MANES_03G172600v8 [Manihot esculenta]|uniref:Uncharacterized protein n=1 Tax=Manihot esculenta TaxID=3983 RepID=A0A251LBP1_MANES|nr:hypothetical protein MANES_03G172600v8 [Manihot esculenta]